MSGFRNWSFTDFSLSTDYKECLKLTYLVYGLETCPTTKRKHHQGYFEMKNQMTMSAIKKALKNTGIYLTVSKGSAQQNEDYCSKENVIEVWGTPKLMKPGKRTDIDKVRDAIKEGATEYEIAEMATSYQAIKCYTTFRNMLIKPLNEDEKPYVRWYYGLTGSGKTLTAKKDFSFNYDMINFENGFIINYTGKDNVIIDEYRGQHPLYKLLQLIDYGPKKFNSKGGECWFGAKFITFTSCYHPSKVYKNCEENIEQLIRRIDAIQYFGKNHSQVGGNIITPALDSGMDSVIII